ncbi:MAG: Rne/Rng family ribonuclease [Hydrogenothermaceae bacterium]|nr:Rne/Rng family ribonuclease [Hydrogenothermaceae bacterium]
MERKLIITTGLKSNLYLIVEDGNPVELKLEDLELSKQAGNIYKGKIKSYSNAMEAFFVDIGEEREAFLPLKDVCPNEVENLKKGSSIIVQVKRTPVSTKGAKLSSKVAVPGKYLVLLPQNKGKVSISSKLEDKDERDLIKEKVVNLLKDYNPENYGIIIRTSAKKATEEDILSDFHFLKELWYSILKDAESKKAPALLYEEPFKAFSIIRDYAAEFTEIISDKIQLLKDIKQFINKNFPKANIKITPYRKRKESLYFEYSIDKVMSKILSPYVYLKNGSYLVIEETEALVVVDVNSGSCHKQKNLEETAFKINIEAAREIVRQIRLRDLAGIIVIDFIDMIEQEHREQLIEFLKNEFKKDKRPVKIKGLTQLGLLELSRKKVEESIVKQLSESCCVCNGKGYIKSEDILLFEIEKTLNKLKPFTKAKLSIPPKMQKSVRELLEKMNLLEEVELSYNNKQQDKFEVEKVE